VILPPSRSGSFAGVLFRTLVGAEKRDMPNVRHLQAVASMALILTACATMDDVKPGTGRSLEIRGHSYDEIWRAVLRVADEHFEILERDQARGVIRAERTLHFMGEGGDWVGIFITPSTPGADVYVVEVVKRKKLRTQLTGQDWEQKVLRDLQDVLAARPMR
jgi:hypothetical protein